MRGTRLGRGHRALFAAGALAAFGLVVGIAAAAPGDLDPSFGDHGVTATATAPGTGGDFQNGLAIQTDRSIVAAGSSDMGAGGDQFRVSRYTKRGDLDASFGSAGTVLTPVSSLGGFDEHIWDVALQQDGKIVAAGEANMGAGAGGANYALARYHPDGSLDASFGGDGIVVTAIAPGDNRDNANAVALQADGKIVAAGGVRTAPSSSTNDFVVARYNADGSLDTSFGGGDGIVITAVAPTRNDGITGLAIQPDRRIVVGGQANMGPGAGGQNFAFARYNADGTLDSSFGGDGIVTTAVAVGDGFDTAWDFALQADGKILGAGNALMGSGHFEVALARYHPDGNLDESFGSGGIATASAPEGDAEVWAVQIDRAGRYVIGGDAVGATFFDSMLARFLPDGALDPSFGSGGFVVTSVAPDAGYDAIFGVALDKTGKIVASGECDQPATGTDVCVARYKAAPDD